MALILPKTCSMGSSQTGLVGVIGITLLNPDGTTHTARVVGGIYEIGGGCYGKNITFPDNWKGSLKWDTGGGSPVYATEDYEVEGLIQEIKTQTDKLHFSGDNVQGRVADKGVLNNPPSENIADYKNEMNEGELHGGLDSYANKDDFKGDGMSEAEHHISLDSYPNKEDWKGSGGGDAGGYAVIGGLQDPEIKKMFKLLEKILKVVKAFSVKPLTEAMTEIEESIQRKQELLKLSFQKMGEQIQKIPQPMDLKEDIEVLQSALSILIECEELKQITQEVADHADTKIAQIEG